MSHARSERAALADLLLEVGPDAPTLCEGWSAADLAAHLVIRDRRPDTSAGILLPPFARYTQWVQGRTKQGNAFAELVDQVRSGPPFWSPLKLGPIDRLTNTIEYFVHHEDVRRAQPGWDQRPVDFGLEDEMWQRLRTGGRVLFRRAPVGVTLVREGNGKLTVKGGKPGVVLRGRASELVLVAYGRGTHAVVEWEGDEESVAALKATRFGI